MQHGPAEPKFPKPMPNTPNGLLYNPLEGLYARNPDPGQNPGTKLNAIRPSKIPDGLDVGAPKDATTPSGAGSGRSVSLPDIDQNRRAKAVMNTHTP